MVLPVLFMLAVGMIAFGTAGCIYLLREKRKYNKRKRKERNSNSNTKRWAKIKIVNGILLVTGLVFFICLIGVVWNSLRTTETNGSENAPVNQGIDAISKEFEELQPNETNTKWEKIIAESLDYALYKENISLIEYENYIHNILFQNGVESAERIHNLYVNYESYLVIKPEYTFEKIIEIIRAQKSSKDVSVEIRKEEVVLYAGDIKEKENILSRETVCQSGRAALDVVSSLCRQSGTDVKDIILYAALAKEYYVYALTMPADNMGSVNQYDEYILYQVGTLYEKLANYNKLIEYRKHFLLEAASLYALASNTGMGREGILENHIYHVDYYRGNVLYNLCNMGYNEESETATKCIENYLKIKDKIPKKYQLLNVDADCDFILKRLKKKS